MNYLKRTALTLGLLPAFMAVPAANAATLNVDVEVDLPSVVILYAYTDVDLTMNANQIGPLLDSNCSNDDCSVANNATQNAVVDNNGNVNLNITNNASSSNATITLQNSWGVRSFGNSSLSPSIVDNGSDTGVENLAIEQINTPSASMQTGWVSFDLNLANISSNSVNARYTIAVVGN